MKKILSLSAAFAAVFAASVNAQTTTEPVGFNTVTCLAGSDTRLSVPLCPETAFVGTVGTAAGAGPAVITPSAAPSWTANQFATYYYVKMTSGARVGWFYQITSNTSGDVTIDLAGDTLGIASADSFRICKFWTLDTLFPVATQTTIIPSLSASASAANRRTELLIPNLTGAGINLAPNQIFFIDGSANGGSGAWKKTTSGNPPSGNFIITPDSFFIVRHANANIASPTTFTVTGGVDLTPVTTSLATQSAAKQDNPVVTGRPVAIALADLDLISTGAFVGSAGTSASASVRKDELLVYNNAAAGVNKGASAIYFYDTTDSHWKKTTSGNPISDAVVIGPSEGFVIRKAALVGGAPVTWTQSF